MLLAAGSGLVLSGLTATAADTAKKAPEAKPAETAVHQADFDLPMPGAAVDKLAFLPPVVAKYNAKEITAAEVRRVIQPYLEMGAANGQNPGPDEIVQMARQLVNSMIDEELLSARAAKDGYKPDAAGAEKKISDMETQIGKEKFADELKRQNLTKEEILKKIASVMMITKWVDEKVKPSVTVDDAVLEKYYKDNQKMFEHPEQTQASHILVKVDKDAKPEVKAEAKKKAEGMLAELKKGADFAKMAKEKSDCPSAKDGGDLGFFAKGQMVPAFEEAASVLKPGELSGVVESDFGFHIIKGGEHKAGGVTEFKDVKEQLRGGMVNRQIGKKMQEMIAGLRTEAKAQVMLPEPKMPAMPPGFPAPDGDAGDNAPEAATPPPAAPAAPAAPATPAAPAAPTAPGGK